jgi:dsDNA-specific endonuclease/ATPase MutS2
MHRSRLCHFVIDVPDLEQGVAFWSAALDATEETVSEQSRHIYRRLRLPDSEIRRVIENSIRRNIGRWPRGRNQETC